MKAPDTRIADVRITPIAFRDPPLLNNAGCHQPFALRSIIEVETHDGVVGLGRKLWQPDACLRASGASRPCCAGLELTDINGLWAKVTASVSDGVEGYNTGFGRLLSAHCRRGRGGDVGCAWARRLDRRVCDLLGGQVRESVPFSAYLFYKFGAHADGTTGSTGERC